MGDVSNSIEGYMSTGRGVLTGYEGSAWLEKKKSSENTKHDHEYAYASRVPLPKTSIT